MITVDIQSNIMKAISATDELFEKDIPFVVAISLNDSAFDVRKRIVGSTYKKAFTVRNKRFAGWLFRVTRVNVGGGKSQAFRSFRSGGSSIDVHVGARDDRASMHLHAYGGVKKPRGTSIAIPSKQMDSKLRNPTGSIKKAKRPINITNQKNTFVLKKGGRKLGIYQRKSKRGRIEKVYGFREKAKIKKTFRFEADATNTALRVFSGYFDTNFSRVVNKWIKRHSL